MNRILFVFIALVIFAGSGVVHEYFLEPETFFSNSKDVVDVRLYVGEGLKKEDEIPFKHSKTIGFNLFGKDLVKELTSSIPENAMPLYAFSAGKEGNYLLSSDRNWFYINLGPNEFEDYLKEEGMEYVIQHRKKLGECNKDGKERYQRYIKTLLQVGELTDTIFSKKTGSDLEIIPYG